MPILPTELSLFVKGRPAASVAESFRSSGLGTLRKKYEGDINKTIGAMLNMTNDIIDCMVKSPSLDMDGTRNTGRTRAIAVVADEVFKECGDELIERHKNDIVDILTDLSKTEKEAIDKWYGYVVEKFTIISPPK